jgi:hypothetical protein
MQEPLDVAGGSIYDNAIVLILGCLAIFKKREKNFGSPGIAVTSHTLS